MDNNENTIIVYLLLATLITAGKYCRPVCFFTSLTTDGSEFESRYDQEFSLLHVVQTGSGAHPASYPTDTPGALSSGVKRQRREAGHSPPASAEVKKM
jgi:hypothetical protein